jgi:hypothetical protein
VRIGANPGCLGPRPSRGSSRPIRNFLRLFATTPGGLLAHPRGRTTGCLDGHDLDIPNPAGHGTAFDAGTGADDEVSLAGAVGQAAEMSSAAVG